MTNQRRTSVVPAVVAVVLTGLFIWALFTFIVRDPALTLEYLKALVWPLLVLVVLFILRVPLQHKLRELLNFKAFGMEADFGRQLQDELQGPIDAVFSAAVEASEGDDAKSAEA